MEVVPSSLPKSLLKDTASPRAIAMTRCRLLKHDGVGLPSILHLALEESLQAFAALLLKDEDSSDASVHVLNDHFCYKALHTVLRIHLQCSQYDACLADELALQGTHLLIRRIIQWEPARKLSEQNIETMMELQDVACEIAALYKSFPRNRAPYPREVLVQRLPLSFHIQPMEKDNHARDKIVASLHSSESHTEELVLIHQVEQRQSAQQDVGFVMWPSAVILSRWLLANATVLSKASCVLEIGAGCGLVGLLAARMVQKQQSTSTRVLLSDFNQVVLENLQRNILLNEVDSVCQTVGLDFYQQSGSSHHGWKSIDGQRHAPVDIILAADMICQPADAVCAANTIHDALVSNGKAFVVCADAAHRFGVDHFAKECQRVGLRILAQEVIQTTPVATDTDLEKTSGFVPGMSLTMYSLEKPNQ